MLGEIGEINSTTVYPSARLSDRVPFGTGPALKKYCEGDQSFEYSYPLEAFKILKSIFSSVEKYYRIGDKLQSEDLSDDASFIGFSYEIKLPDKIRELISNCSSPEIFKKRFFHLFNAIKVLKWLNYALLHGFSSEKIINESSKLILLMGIDKNSLANNPNLMLTLFRSLDKNRTNY
jgi:hypothetical protein